MKNLKRKFVSMIIPLGMVFACLPVSVLAEDGTGSSGTAVAEANGKTYSSLTAAIKSSATTEITLLSDVTENVKIEKDYTVTLNLNGHKITNVSDHTIYVEGSLTVNGEGEVDNVTHGKAALFNDNTGAVTVNSGTFERSKEAGKNPDNSGGNSYYTVLNFGTMVINNGTFTSSGRFSSLVRNGDNSAKTISYLTINGGTFSGGINTIKNDENSDLSITGGTFSNTTQYAVQNWDKATISGGTFVADEQVLFNTDAKGTNIGSRGDLTITGGTFTSGSSYPVFDTYTSDNPKLKDYVSDPLFGHLNITGGEFNTMNLGTIDDTTATLPEGYKFFKNTTDGYYTVAKKISSLKIDSELSLNVNDQKQLTVESDQPLETVSYKSDSDCVTVDENGTVTAVKPGKATITATADNLSATCVVTVNSLTVSADKDSLSDSSKKTGVKDEESLKTVEKTATDTVNAVLEGNNKTDAVSKETAENVTAAVKDGKTISTEVVADPVKLDDADKTEVKKINELIKDETKKDKEAAIGQVLDIKVLLKANDTEILGTITKLNAPISITAKIDESLLKEGRTFYVVRVHDGKAEKLPTTDNGDGTVTFTTDSFSTYAIVYEDAKTETKPSVKPEEPKKDETKPTDSKKDESKKNNGKKEAVNTSDRTSVGFNAVVTLAALAACGYVVTLKRRH